MYTDLPEPQLWDHTSALVEPDDFDEFWAATLAEARRHDRAPVATPVTGTLTAIDAYDVTFPGFAGEDVRAWWRVPRGATGPLPVIVQFQGYGGGRGHVLENLQWSAAGYAHLMMDTRGQGSVWSHGDTPDPWGGGPAVPGVMTRGLTDPSTYYYRRLVTDAVRAVDAARLLPGADPTRVAVVGASQGGAMTIAAAALADVQAASAHVPFLCDIARAIGITDNAPYSELRVWLAQHRDAEEVALRTLSYVDGVAFARRARVPARISVALMDEIVPPSGVVAAHRAWAGPKELRVFRYNGHESGGPVDDAEALAFFGRTLGA